MDFSQDLTKSWSVEWFSLGSVRNKSRAPSWKWHSVNISLITAHNRSKKQYGRGEIIILGEISFQKVAKGYFNNVELM